MLDEQIWLDDKADATEKWTVSSQLVEPGRVLVEAEAGTGSRYVVTAMYGPEHTTEILGAPVIVTVHYPWQTAYAVHAHALTENYIAEKFLRPGRRLTEVHGGDFAAIVRTINWALVLLAEVGR